MPSSTSRDHLLDARLRAVTRTLQGVREGDARSIHRARIASRRLRELLPVLGLEKALTDKVVKRLRKTRRRLGAVREFDVLLLLLDDMRKTRQHPDMALRRAAAHIRELRAQAWTPEMGKRGAAGFARVARWLEAGGSDVKDADATGKDTRAWRWAVEARMVRRTSGLVQAIEDAGTTYVATRLHRVRIALKKLRYGLELAVEASGRTSDPDLTELKRVQSLLGRMHDQETLMNSIRQLQGSRSADDRPAFRDLDRLLAFLETSCRRLHARYLHERDAVLVICQRRGAKAAGGARHGLARRAG